jgi:hypothetical protein
MANPAKDSKQVAEFVEQSQKERTMAVTFAQPSESLAPIAEFSNEKRDLSNSKRAQANDETTKPEEANGTRRESFFDHLRRALSTLHV